MRGLFAAAVAVTITLAPAAWAEESIPVLGCDDHMFDAPAPPPSSISVNLPSPLAARLAYFTTARGWPMILAPRDWKCGALDGGSGGAGLFIGPDGEEPSARDDAVGILFSAIFLWGGERPDPALYLRQRFTPSAMWQPYVTRSLREHYARNGFDVVAKDCVAAYSPAGLTQHGANDVRFDTPPGKKGPTVDDPCTGAISSLFTAGLVSFDGDEIHIETIRLPKDQQAFAKAIADAQLFKRR
jgi:hypothetical protein